MKRLWIFVSVLMLSICVVGQDSDFVRAQAFLTQIENGMKTIKVGDVNTYNALAAQLKETRGLLQSTGSKDQQGYSDLVKRWNKAKEDMVAMANAWKNPNSQKATAPAAAATQSAAPQASPNKAAQQSQPVATTLTQAQIKQNIAAGLGKADFINSASETDINRINNIGGDFMYEANKKELSQGISAIEMTQANGGDATTLADQKTRIIAAQEKLERFRSLYLTKKKERAAKPKVAKKKSGSQKLWLNGSMVCEITKSGQVWIRSKKVGDIEDNGKIWVNSSRKGSIEKNGDVWHNGRKVGSITAKGEVWKNGSKIGLIQGGKVWIGGSAKGEIVGSGDWRKAAIVYYFDFF